MRPSSNLIPFINNQTIIQFTSITCTYNNKTYTLNKEFLKRLVKSNALTSLYKKCLKWQSINKTSEQTKETFCSFIDGVQLYFTNLGQKALGATISSGIIFIHEKYFNNINEEVEEPENIQSLAAIVTIVLHEFAHCILRIMRENISFYVNTEEKEIEATLKRSNSEVTLPKKSLKKLKQSESSQCLMIKKPTMKEIGNYFDKLLYGTLPNLYVEDSLFILNLRNYNYDYDTFNREFNVCREFAPNTKISSLPLKQTGDGSLSLEGKCFFELFR